MVKVDLRACRVIGVLGDTTACGGRGRRNGQRSCDGQWVVMPGGSVVFLSDGSISRDDDRTSLGEEDVEAVP